MQEIEDNNDMTKYLLHLTIRLKDDATRESKLQDVSLAKYIRQAISDKITRDKATRDKATKMK